MISWVGSYVAEGHGVEVGWVGLSAGGCDG